jgi:hypothetical protein
MKGSVRDRGIFLFFKWAQIFCKFSNNIIIKNKNLVRDLQQDFVMQLTTRCTKAQHNMQMLKISSARTMLGRECLIFPLCSVLLK